ncbi:MAG TPA: alpha/beta hydrolase [Gemmatimonadales bacterium]|nr:alpha/beta hydrolase [Gemmatimonadales bacterium]
MLTIAYGADPDQAGDLYLPDVHECPLVCLFHGGFWRMPYGRDQLDPMALDLSQAGVAVWNLGYRRVGPGGHPWPATLRDVEAALALLPELGQAHPRVNLRRLVLVGHSAGGQLAFWGARKAREITGSSRPAAVVGLAPILDLMAAAAAGLGRGAVEQYLGGSPSAVPDRYREASPAAHVPLGIPQYVLHGEDDAAVPPRLSEDYIARAREAGDEATYVPLPGTDHMALIDPRSPAFARVRRYILSPT